MRTKRNQKDDILFKNFPRSILHSKPLQEGENNAPAKVLWDKDDPKLIVIVGY